MHQKSVLLFSKCDDLIIEKQAKVLIFLLKNIDQIQIYLSKKGKLDLKKKVFYFPLCLSLIYEIFFKVQPLSSTLLLKMSVITIEEFHMGAGEIP